MSNTTTSIVARILAVLGIVAVGFPIATPLALASYFLVVGEGPILDYLMPGELIVVVLAGGVLLLVTSLIIRRRRRLVAWMFAAAGTMFLATSIVASATGLSSGKTQAEGWPLVLVNGVYALYVAAVIGLFVSGIILCRTVFRQTTAPASSFPMLAPPTRADGARR